MAKRPTNAELQERVKQQSRVISLLTNQLTAEVRPSYDLDQFEQAVQRSVWLFVCTYTLAFALQGIGFKVVSRSSGKELNGRRARDLRRLMERVNEEDTYEDWVERNVVHLSLAGETYVEKVRGGLGVTAEMWTWNPNNVIPIPDKSGKRRIRAYKFHEGGLEKTLPAEDVVAVRIYNPANPLRGASAVAPMNMDLQGDRAAAQHNRALLEKGGRIGGVLKPTDGDLGDHAWRQLTESLRIQNEGAANAGKHMVLPGS